MQITRTITKHGVVINGEGYIFDNFCDHVGRQIIIEHQEDDVPSLTLPAAVDGRAVILRYTGGHVECPSCLSVEICPEDKFCTWCASDLRPSHYVRPCCGFSSMNRPHRYCPMCGVATAGE